MERKHMSRPTGTGFPSYLGPKKEPGDSAIVVTGIAAVAGMFVLIAGLGILRAFVMVKMWEWFVVPTFTSAPELTIAPAFGLTLLISFLTYQSTQREEGGAFWGSVILLPLFTLLMGWIVQFWM
jgi:hypothetical protein